MMHTQYFLFTFLIPATSGTIDVGFLKGIPRLNNNSYWDYYFLCTSTGQTLQWYVNNSALGELSQVAEVMSGITSAFNFIATALSSKPTSLEDYFEWTSLLIVSCFRNCELEATCTNGSNNKTVKNVNNGLIVNNGINDTTVFLEYILTENELELGDSKCASIFMCGVNNMFMTWKVNKDGFNDLSYTITDNFGQERRTLQDNSNTVKQQSILIGQQLYTLVTVLIVIHNSEELTVTCGYSQHEVNLTIEKLPITSQGSFFVTSSMSNNEVTATIDTMSNYIGLTVSLTIVGFITIGIIFLIPILIIRNLRKQIKIKTEQVHTLTLKRKKSIKKVNHVKELPLKSFDEIKTPSQEMENIDYSDFCLRINYVISIYGKEVLEAATTAITSPDIEQHNGTLTKIDNVVYVGMIGDKPVGLVKHDSEENSNQNFEQNIEKNIANAIKKWFKHAKYVLAVGCCCAFKSSDKCKFLGDVLISESIFVFNKNEKKSKVGVFTEVDPDFLELVRIRLEHVEGLQVTSDRKTHFDYGGFATGPKIFKKDPSNSFGYEMSLGNLIPLQLEGIKMDNINVLKLQVIAIQGIYWYISEKKQDIWKFTASRAAFHYVNKIISPESETN